MAKEIVWSFEATSDLTAIADYIAKDSTYYAASFVQEVREASRSLSVFAKRGRSSLNFLIQIFVNFL